MRRACCWILGVCVSIGTAAGPGSTVVANDQQTIDPGATVDDEVGSPAPEEVDQPADEPERTPADVRPSGPVMSASRVRVKLDVEGELFATAGRGAPPIRRPITVDARFDFIESALAEDAAPTVERRYRDATAELRIDGEPRRASLAADARTVRLVLRGTTPSPYLEGGFLARDERDLLETPFDPLLIDALRPAAAIAVGGSWEIPADIVAGLLAIDTVESGGITARLADVADGTATVALSGIVDGAADGVPTHVTIDGSFTTTATTETAGDHALHGRVASVAVTLRERREASHVAPGFDVEARLAIARASGDEDTEPTRPAAAASPYRRQGPGRAGLVWHRDSAGRYDVVHDDRWRVIEDGADGLVMRLVDSGALVAQCAIMPLPRGSAASTPTIAEVERDIERSLGGQFGRIEHASEATRTDGVRIVRVVTAGRADDLPFRWIHHVLSDAAGHRLAVTCMLEASMEKRFGNADRELVDGIGLPGGADVDRPAAGDREARVPQESRMP